MSADRYLHRRHGADAHRAVAGAEPRAGHKLIREAAAQGADYVLTPEVSNMMQLNRKALFEHLAAEEDDLSLKAYRALAAELKIHLHIGSLALRAYAGAGGQPLVPDRAGRRM